MFGFIKYPLLEKACKIFPHERTTDQNNQIHQSSYSTILMRSHLHRSHSLRIKLHINGKNTGLEKLQPYFLRT